MAPTRSSTKISRAAKTETKRSAVRESSQEHDRDANDSQASQISDDLDVAKMIQGMMKSVSDLDMMWYSDRIFISLLMPNFVLVRPRNAMRRDALRYGRNTRSRSNA